MARQGWQVWFQRRNCVDEDGREGHSQQHKHSGEPAAVHSLQVKGGGQQAGGLLVIDPSQKSENGTGLRGECSHPPRFYSVDRERSCTNGSWEYKIIDRSSRG